MPFTVVCMANQQTQRSMDEHSNNNQKRVVAAAAERNKQPILQVLRAHLKPFESQIHVLEAASGTGQHAAYFAENIPHLVWQPTELSPEMFDSIRAWSDTIFDNGSTVLEPVVIDCSTPEDWTLPQISYHAVLCINMTHISPYKSTQGLFQGAARVLLPGGRLFLYGPFKVDGNFTTESNAQFDALLQSRDSSWGLRDIQSELDVEAGKVGLVRVDVVAMPANNFTVIYEMK